MKKSASRDKLCLCKRVQSRWTRQSNFAPTRRVPQEAKWGRAISVSMVANDHVTSAIAVKRHLAQGKAHSLKDSVQRKRVEPHYAVKREGVVEKTSIHWHTVEPHYPVTKHKTPLRRRTLGRLPRGGTDSGCFFGRPRLFGGTQRGGAI